MTESNYYSIRFLDAVKEIARRWKLILICGVICGVIGFLIFNFLIDPVYEANATVLVNTRSDVSSVVTNDQITSAENLVDTYAVIIQSRTVLDTVIERLDLTDTYKSLNSSVDISGVNGTQIIEISVRRESAQQAVQILQEILNIAPDFIIQSVGAGSVNIIDQAQADPEPVWPNIPFYSVLAFFVGVLLAIFGLLLKLLNEVTYTSEEELQQDLNVVVLGVIPDKQSCMVKMWGARK